MYYLQNENTEKLNQVCSQTSLMLVNNIKSTLSSQSKIDLCHLNDLIDYLERMKEVPKSNDLLSIKQEEFLDLEHESSNGFVKMLPLNKYPTRRSLNKQFGSSLETELVDSALMKATNDSVEKLKQMYNKCNLENQKLHEKCEKIEKDWESRYNQSCEVADKALDEAKRFKDECTDLENGMDALRNEYFECEEYWSLKLDEERKLNDLVCIIIN